MANDKAATEKAKSKTITITFGEEDTPLYNALVEDAKKQRRTLSQYTLLFLLSNYSITDSE